MLVISPDHYLLDRQLMMPFLGYPVQEYKFSGKRAGAAWKRAYKELHAAVESGDYQELVLLCGIPGAGKSTWLSENAREGVIYFDATFTNEKARRPVIKMGRDAGVKVSVQILNTPFEECVRRNSLRTPDRIIPGDAMVRMQGALRKSLPTSLEGVEVQWTFPPALLDRARTVQSGLRSVFYWTLEAAVRSQTWQAAPTWVWESSVALLVLLGVFLASPGVVNAVAGAAVFCTFLYMTVSFRLMEAQDKQDEATVECYRKLPYYLWAKEILWLTVFLLTGAYTAIVGNFLFLGYPMWRNFYRYARRKF